MEEGGRFGAQAHAVDQDLRLWNRLCDDDLPVWQGFQFGMSGENAWNGEWDGAAGISAEQHFPLRSEEHTSELQSRLHLVCRLLLEKKKTMTINVQMRV